MSLNKQLAKAIAESQISISRIAQKAGVSRTHIYNILHDDKNVSSVTLEKICKAINVSPASLYEKEIVRIDPPEDLSQKENTVRIIGRGGVVKEYKVTERERKMFEALLEAESEDPNLKY